MVSVDSLFRGYSILPDNFYRTENWVCWRYEDRDGGKTAKVPLSPITGERVDITNSDASTDFVTAALYHNEGDVIDYHEVIETDTDGLGFVFTPDDPFVGIDIDDCITVTGSLEPWAAEIVETVDGYTEYSPSGTGVHCICKGSLPHGGSRNGNLEMYEEGRFFTVTAAPVPYLDAPDTTSSRCDELRTVYLEHIASEPDSNYSVERHSPAITTGGGNELSDNIVLQKATEATNGDKFERLWTGVTAGYPSQSEADLALCCLLAFWTGGCPQQIDRLFRQSALYRTKWDESRGKQTYGDRTISEAINKTEDFYGA